LLLRSHLLQRFTVTRIWLRLPWFTLLIRSRTFAHVCNGYFARLRGFYRISTYVVQVIYHGCTRVLYTPVTPLGLRAPHYRLLPRGSLLFAVTFALLVATAYLRGYRTLRSLLHTRCIYRSDAVTRCVCGYRLRRCVWVAVALCTWIAFYGWTFVDVRTRSLLRCYGLVGCPYLRFTRYRGYRVAFRSQVVTRTYVAVLRITVTLPHGFSCGLFVYVVTYAFTVAYGWLVQFCLPPAFTLLPRLQLRLLLPFAPLRSYGLRLHFYVPCCRCPVTRLNCYVFCRPLRGSLVRCSLLGYLHTLPHTRVCCTGYIPYLQFAGCTTLLLRTWIGYCGCMTRCGLLLCTLFSSFTFCCLVGCFTVTFTHYVVVYRTVVTVVVVVLHTRCYAYVVHFYVTFVCGSFVAFAVTVILRSCSFVWLVGYLRCVYARLRYVVTRVDWLPVAVAALPRLRTLGYGCCRLPRYVACVLRVCVPLHVVICSVTWLHRITVVAFPRLVAFYVLPLRFTLVVYRGCCGCCMVLLRLHVCYTCGCSRFTLRLVSRWITFTFSVGYTGCVLLHLIRYGLRYPVAFAAVVPFIRFRCYVATRLLDFVCYTLHVDVRVARLLVGLHCVYRCGLRLRCCRCCVCLCYCYVALLVTFYCVFDYVVTFTLLRCICCSTFVVTLFPVVTRTFVAVRCCYTFTLLRLVLRVPVVDYVCSTTVLICLRCVCDTLPLYIRIFALPRVVVGALFVALTRFAPHAGYGSFG